MNSPDSSIDSDVSKIAAIREVWFAAMKAGDANRLADRWWTDDLVVVHGNGRCVGGKQELKADFLEGFAQFAIEQRVLSADVIVHNNLGI